MRTAQTEFTVKQIEPDQCHFRKKFLQQVVYAILADKAHCDLRKRSPFALFSDGEAIGVPPDENVNLRLKLPFLNNQKKTFRTSET